MYGEKQKVIEVKGAKDFQQGVANAVKTLVSDGFDIKAAVPIIWGGHTTSVLIIGVKP